MILFWVFIILIYLARFVVALSLKFNLVPHSRRVL